MEFEMVKSKQQTEYASIQEIQEISKDNDLKVFVKIIGDIYRCKVVNWNNETVSEKVALKLDEAITLAIRNI